MSKKVKKVVDRLLSAVALLGVTAVPFVYIVGIVSMQRQINALEAQVEYMTEQVVNEIRQDALADVVEETPVGVVDSEEQEEQEVQEAPQQEAPQQEVPQQEVPQQEVPQQEVPQQEVPQQEVPRPIIPVAEGEEELLVRLVIAESGSQPYEGQVAVAQVVCDRYVAGYGDSITDVIYAKNQFAKPYSKDISDYPLASDAVHAVLYEGERAFIETTLFFCNPSRSSASGLAWMRTKPYIGTIADHEFYGV